MKAVYRKQSGVTIIEVLFAIGIIMVGLMGIAGLIIVAGTQLTQGLQADGMSNLGLNAIEEFDMRHMRQQDNLLTFDTNNATFVNFSTVESYCIDPYFISQQVVNFSRFPQQLTPTNLQQIRFFPGVTIPAGNPNQVAVMPRVTIANAQGIFNDPTFYDPNTFGAGVARIMNELQAQELFTAKDNLALRESDSPTELPRQVWFEDRLLSTSPSARASDGIDNDHDGFVDEADEAFVRRIGFGDMARLGATEFSWMVTVTPDRTFMVDASGRPAGRDRTDQYLISIVVFHNRVINYNAATLEDQERMLEVTLRGNGFGGGEVRLHSGSVEALDLNNGDWVMLSALSTLGPQFRWYKVSYVDDEVQTAAPGSYYRDATLQGPDWNRAEWLPTANTPPQFKTHATFVPHVIGVFEKTIRMETTSLY